MKTTATAFVFMERDFPKLNGKTNYGAEQVWGPTVWTCRVDDNSERIFISEQQVPVEVPDNFNPVPHQVAALEKEKAEALELFQKTVAGINERLSKLLCITMDAA